MKETLWKTIEKVRSARRYLRDYVTQSQSLNTVVRSFNAVAGNRDKPSDILNES